MKNTPDVKNLGPDFLTSEGRVEYLKSVSFDVGRGKTSGLVFWRGTVVFCS